MNKRRQHLRLNYRKKTLVPSGETHLEASRKRLLGLALGASLAGAGCGDFEPIPPMAPPQDAGHVTPNDAGDETDSGHIAPMPPPWDVGDFHDAGAETDAGETADSGPYDSGEIPPMPPPRDSGTSPRDTGTPPRDTGTSRRDTGVVRRDMGAIRRDTGHVPPMPPPREDAGRRPEP